VKDKRTDDKLQAIVISITYVPIWGYIALYCTWYPVDPSFRSVVRLS